VAKAPTESTSDTSDLRLRKEFRKLSVVMPAHNEERTIGEMIDRVLAIDLPLLLELVIVDDGSLDGTWEIASAVQDNRVRTVRQKTNDGKGAALRTGIAACSGDVVVFQDADLEYDPAAFAAMLQALVSCPDGAVYGSRFMGEIAGMRLRNRLGNRALSMLTNVLFGSALTDMETCYKMARKSTFEALQLSASGFDIEPEITTKLLRSGRPIVEVPIDYEARTVSAGKKIGVSDGFQAVATLLRARFR
jgi:glycosyltransferase involved in cell wall biosynthesis